VRRADGIFALSLVTLLLAAGIAAPVRANAVQPPCTSQRLDRTDKVAARRAVIKAAGNHKILWSTQKICTWRNRTSKHRTTRVDLQTETLADGSTVERSLHCYDDVPDWKCDEYSGRNLDTKLMLGGKEHKIHLWLPNEFDSGAVHDLLARTFALAPRQTVAGRCAVAFDRTPTTLEQDLLPQLKKSFDPQFDEWYLKIEEWSGRVEVHSGDFFLEFSRSGEVPGWYEFQCWNLDEKIGV
jgi:hypothetical protein